MVERVRGSSLPEPDTAPVIPAEPLLPLLASRHKTTRDALARYFYRHPRREAVAALEAAVAVETAAHLRTRLDNALAQCAACASTPGDAPR